MHYFFYLLRSYGLVAHLNPPEAGEVGSRLGYAPESPRFIQKFVDIANIFLILAAGQVFVKSGGRGGGVGFHQVRQPDKEINIDRVLMGRDVRKMK